MQRKRRIGDVRFMKEKLIMLVSEIDLILALHAFPLHSTMYVPICCARAKFPYRIQ